MIIVISNFDTNKVGLQSVELCCSGGVAVADEMHMIFERPALRTLRQQYAYLFSTNIGITRSFFAQEHMQVFKFVLSCLDVFQI